mmetsp:Transcript_68981/g.177788  ORF Transcript_68981/g.177788 Transcript_68981/m.177788 type:complete len:441 (-) Transcript_68981:112-1434(-)
MLRRRGGQPACGCCRPTKGEDAPRQPRTVIWREVPLQPLPRLLSREEAFAVCAFLNAEDVAHLTCASRGQCREAIWRAYFVLRWGSELGATHSTEVRCMRSWLDDAWPAPWPLAVGFCGARSSMDHLFWIIPVFRCVFGIDKPRHTPLPALPPAAAWQVVCRVRAQPRGWARMARCFVCNVLEVAPPGPNPQHFRQRWARPCADCPTFTAHRACLEKQLLSAESALKCRICGREYRTDRRFPESLAELLAATLQEWRWVVRRVFVMMLFFFWLYSLAEHYAMLDGFCKEIRMLMIMTACMMSISVSQRFHQGVQAIWNTPHRWHYLKLFGLFAVLSYLASLRVFEPSLWSGVARQQPLLAAIHRVHSLFYDSLLGTLALASVSCLYAIAASGVIFAFWRTSLRVPTVADAGAATQNELLRRSTSGCGLCQLGLCLDNTGM